MDTNSLIVDTYPSFLRAIGADKPVTVNQWITCWAEHYMPQWPTLHEMVVNDYVAEGEDWRRIAREMVFPEMNDKLPAIQYAYENMQRVIEPVEENVRRAFDFHDPVCHVFYIGIGNGAGWVTKYEGSWAVLFGLEAIVDSGFDEPARLEGLVAHELGHVVHHVWRASRGLGLGSGPWWQLYEEGFAQLCESMVVPGDGWHMRSKDNDDEWLAWCQANRAWLAREFLRVADYGESVRPFFGSWYEIRGHKQTGYYLGHQVLSDLVNGMEVSDIALIDSGRQLEQIMRDVLQKYTAV